MTSNRLILLVALWPFATHAGFEYRPPTPPPASPEPAEDVAPPASALTMDEAASGEKPVVVATPDPVVITASAGCVAGLHLGAEVVADVVVPARRGTGTWGSLLASLGNGWVATGPGAATAITWAHGQERVSDVLDRVAKMHGACVYLAKDVLTVTPASARSGSGSAVVADADVAPAVEPSAGVAPGALAPTEPASAAVPAAAQDLALVDATSAQGEAVLIGSADEYVPPVVVPPWSMEPGETLRECLQRWAARAGHTVVWEPNYDLRIEVAAEFPGDTGFTEVVETVLRSYWRSGEKLRGRHYAGNRVLLVTAEE